MAHCAPRGPAKGPPGGRKGPVVTAKPPLVILNPGSQQQLTQVTGPLFLHHLCPWVKPQTQVHRQPVQRRVGAGAHRAPYLVASFDSRVEMTVGSGWGLGRMGREVMLGEVPVQAQQAGPEDQGRGRTGDRCQSFSRLPSTTPSFTSAPGEGAPVDTGGSLVVSGLHCVCETPSYLRGSSFPLT